MSDASRIGKQVQIAVKRAEHNALAGVEDMCTGTAAKLKRYAPLLRRVAKWKAALLALTMAIVLLPIRACWR